MIDHEWLNPLAQLLTSVPVRTRQRGMEYAHRRRVSNIRMSDDGELKASVRGSEGHTYETVLSLLAGPSGRIRIHAECSCPVGYACKHAVAVACKIIDYATTGKDDDGAIDISISAPELLPARTPTPRKKAATPGTRGPAGLPWWEQYVAASGTRERIEGLCKGIRKHLGNYVSTWQVDSAASRLLDRLTPLSALYHFEELLSDMSLLYARPQPLLDNQFEEFLKQPDWIAALEAEKQSARESALVEWLADDTARHASGARMNVEFSVYKSPERIPRLACRVLVSGGKLTRSARYPQAIAQLQRDIDAGTRSMPPWEASFLRWMSHRHEIAGAGGTSASVGALDPADRFLLPVHDPVAWLARWAHAPFLTWDDGAPIVLSAVDAYLTIARPAGGNPYWAVAFSKPDGGVKMVPLRDADCVVESVEFAHRESDPVQFFVKEENTLHLVQTRDMPLNVLEAIYAMDAPPIERIREQGVGLKLIARLARSKEDAAALVAHVPVRPSVECWLDGDALRVCVKAIADDKTVFCLGADGRWRQPAMRVCEQLTGQSFGEIGREEEGQEERQTVECPSGIPSTEHALSIAPRAEDVAAIEAWTSALLNTRVNETLSSDSYPALERRVGPKDFPHIVRVWSERPRGVTYLGNDAFRSLVSVQKAPRFRVQVESSGADWLQVSVEMEDELDRFTWRDVETALATSQSDLVSLPSGRFYRRGELETYRQQLESLTTLGIETGVTQRIHAMQLGALGHAALADLGESDERFRHFAEASRKAIAKFKGIPAAKIDAVTAAFLRPYQRAGSDFLVWAVSTFGGALLADDMGLGKTLQVLAAITALRGRDKKKRPSLVVCPASVVHNWQREADRFAPHLRTLVIERGKARHDLYESLDQYDLVIKNYTLLRMDFDKLREREWLLACVDEAQAIKNPDADIKRTVRQLNAQYRIALTGTPIENRITDLWSILDFVVPSYLEHRQELEVKAKSDEARRVVQMLRARLRPVMLRRMKEEVAPELPPRIEERRDCEMTPRQRTAYLAEVKKTRLMLDGIKSEKVTGPGRIQILAALTRLRQLCCDPGLLGLEDRGSGKINELIELLPPLLEAGHKVLVFSQFVRMLARIETVLAERGIPLFKLTGATTKRQQLVDSFESHADPCVFLISLKAGGSGLNLTSASHVVLFDPWWNPAVEAQAIDRTHRIGQDKTVVAFRLVTLGTIEERIIELRQKKSKLVKDVLEEDAFNRTLTRDDFDFLLRGD